MLHALDNRNFTGETGITVDVGALGNFQIYHVPNDGNCLFTAIGHFVEMDQGQVRQQIGAKEGRWGDDRDAATAARVFGRRVFIVNHNFETNAPDPNTIRGYNNDGEQINMAELGQQQIDPDRDIVLYAILDPSPNPGEGGRHWEALVRAPEHELDK